MKKNSQEKIPLDIAGLLFSYTKNKKWSNTYRFSAILKEDVDGELLKKAVAMLYHRFPTYFVRLTTGFFWKQYKNPPLDVDRLVTCSKSHCAPIDTREKDLPLFRIHYWEKRISIDMFHGVTDGHGTMIFMKTLLATYFNLQGCNIPATHEILDLNEAPKAEEFEDGIIKFYKKGGDTLKRKEPASYQHYVKEEDIPFHVIQLKFSASELKKITKAAGFSVTQYLATVYAYSFYVNKDPKDKRPLKIQFPVDMRKPFGLNTLRNFSLVTTLTIPNRDKPYSFDELLGIVKDQLAKGSDKEYLQKMINTNASDALMPVAKYSPSFMKKPVLLIGFKMYGERLMTAPFSNVGIFDVPEEMQDKIEYCEAIIGKTTLNSINTAALTYGDNLIVSFGSTKARRDVQDTFAEFIRSLGIEVEYTLGKPED